LILNPRLSLPLDLRTPSIKRIAIALLMQKAEHFEEILELPKAK
jgi:hypothetical protein